MQKTLRTQLMGLIGYVCYFKAPLNERCVEFYQTNTQNIPDAIWIISSAYKSTAQKMSSQQAFKVSLVFCTGVFFVFDILVLHILTDHFFITFSEAGFMTSTVLGLYITPYDALKFKSTKTIRLFRAPNSETVCQVSCLTYLH